MGIGYQQINVRLINKKTGEKITVKKKFEVPKKLVYKEDFTYYDHNIVYG